MSWCLGESNSDATKETNLSQYFFAQISATFFSFINLLATFINSAIFTPKAFEQLASVKCEFYNLLNALAMQILHFQAKSFRAIFKHVQILHISSEEYIFYNLENALCKFYNFQALFANTQI